MPFVQKVKLPIVIFSASVFGMYICALTIASFLRSVYAAEKAMGPGGDWHKTCLKVCPEMLVFFVFLFFVFLLLPLVYTHRLYSDLYSSTTIQCPDCNKLLDSTTLCEHDGLVWCKACYGKRCFFHSPSCTMTLRCLRPLSKFSDSVPGLDPRVTASRVVRL